MNKITKKTPHYVIISGGNSPYYSLFDLTKKVDFNVLHRELHKIYDIKYKQKLGNYLSTDAKCQ